MNPAKLVARMVEIANRDDTTGLAADALREGSEIIDALAVIETRSAMTPQRGMVRRMRARLAPESIKELT